MNSLALIIVSSILLALGIGLGLYFILHSYTKSKKEFNELIDPILKDLNVIGYGNIKPDYLKSLFKDKELQQNKFLTRPFMVLTSPNLSLRSVYLVVPQFTNHKTNKFANNLYLDNNTKYINLEQALFVCGKDLTILDKNTWASHVNNVNETNRNIEIVKNVTKHTLWITRGGSEIRGQHLLISETLKKCGLEKDNK